MLERCLGWIVLAGWIGLVFSGAAGCGSDEPLPQASIQPPQSSAGDSADAASELEADDGARSLDVSSSYPEVVIETSLGEIHVQLDAEKAPRTVEHFLTNHVSVGFYDNTVFHYVEDGTMLIGGGYTQDLELVEHRGEVYNEADNGLQNQRGTISMSRYPDARHSGTCQFFINLADNAFLDHENDADDAKFGYCVFGKVIDGLAVADKIGGVEVHDVDGFPNTPVQPVVIKSIRRVK